MVLRRQLHVGSEAWERKQEAAALKGEGAVGGRRDYRISMVARGELDMVFLRGHELLMSSPIMFSLLPEPDLSEEILCLAFRMNSKAHAAVERSMFFRHRRPPFLLFLCGQQPVVAAKLKHILQHSPCLLDSPTREFMEEFDNEGRDAQAAL